jgi:hypothetical protein
LVKRGLVDHRTDIYSLGATLYELLTLQPIFDGRDRHELLQQIADAEPRPPRALDKRIPEELETIILKAAAKEPSERYASAQDLADDLQRFREDRPIRARRPTPLEKTTKWARRHKGAVVSAIAVLLLFAAGMSVTTFLVAQAYERERQERAQADKSFRDARKAVDQLAQIGEELAGNPLLEATRRHMLATALDYYANFIAQHRNDPSIRDDLEASHAKAQKILNELTTLMGLNQYALVKERAIQELLQLSEKQRKEVAEIDGLWSKMVGEFHGSAQEWERRRLQLAQEQKRQVEKILDDSQLRRFRQIALQSLGPAAFREPEVITTLNLSAAQREQIRAIEASTVFIGAVYHLHSGPLKSKPPPQVRLQSLGELRTSTLTQIQQEVLTPVQVQRWKDLTGEPVDARIFSSERRFFTQEVRAIGGE